jgi:4-hydroxy-3-methylbut-2-en-1-yl diphosphate reductase
MHILTANPRGFCAGVDRAISIVERALEEFGPPVYVRREIVHNSYVVRDLTSRGAVFVRELEAVPRGSPVIFSAHGVSPAVRAEARSLGLLAVDATCPLVAKIHLDVALHRRCGRSVILIGHRGHPEIEGTLGHFDPDANADILVIENEQEANEVRVPDPSRVAYATQTTLSTEDTERIIGVLRARFPSIVAPHSSDICYATRNRQMAARTLADRCDVVIVVGATHSSNSSRLLELVRRAGVRGHLVADAAQLERDWMSSDDIVGVTSGASVPDVLVRGVLARLQTWWPGTGVEEFGEPERLVFSLPRELRRVERQR